VIRYLDTSALVKRYVEEAGSPAVRRWLASGTPATARFSLVEVASAIARRSREGDLPRGEAERIGDCLEEDARGLLLVELLPAVEARARALLAVHALRTGDALQLASCLHLQGGGAGGVEFVTWDRRLAGAARAEGLRTRGGR
jgi:hypothetical protein